MENTILFLKKYWFVIIGLLVIGFFAGRCDSKIITKTEYIKGETITDTIYSEKLVPYEVKVPYNPILPLRVDTIRIPGKPEYIAMVVDTAAIIADYVLLNKYSRIMFDTQTEGKLIVSGEVQYNKLQKLVYDFTPMTKKVTIEKVPVFTPFVMASYNTLGYFGVGAGMYYHNIGASYKYLSDFNNSTGHEFGLHIKF